MNETLAVHSLADALTDSLRDLIMTNGLPGGTIVTENWVAERYDVARPTAKAAIERLVSAGLLTRGPHKSARIPILTAESIHDIYMCRGCIESVSAVRLAAASKVPPGAIEQIHRLRESGSTGSVVQMVESDIRFHRELVDGVGSHRLSRMHAMLMGEMQLCMAQVQANRLMRLSEIVEDHESIITLIEQGDAIGASAAVAAHLDNACTALMHHFDPASSQ